VLKNSIILLTASIAGFERNWWSDWHEYHLESFYCSVDHRRQLHNRHCMWQKLGRLRSRKPRSLKSGGLKPSSLIEVYAYDGNSVFHAKKQYLYSKIWEFGANGVNGSKFLVKNVIFGNADPDLPIHYATFMGLRWWIRVVYSWEPPLLSIFRRKKFGNLGANGVRGSKFLVENVIFGIADPDLPIHYATFMELRWWLRVVYSWAPPLLSIFRRKKQKSSVFSAKIWQFLGINRGLILNLSFITPKRHILAWFHV